MMGASVLYIRNLPPLPRRCEDQIMSPVEVQGPQEKQYQSRPVQRSWGHKETIAVCVNECVHAHVCMCGCACVYMCMCYMCAYICRPCLHVPPFPVPADLDSVSNQLPQGPRCLGQLLPSPKILHSTGSAAFPDSDPALGSADAS